MLISSPQATINVGGRVLSAMTIEHFILRLPYGAKHVRPLAASSLPCCPSLKRKRLKSLNRRLRMRFDR